MKRRAFLSLLGAAGAVPVLPGAGALVPAANTYNRYMYGLAVFHARTKSSVSARDLMDRLKVDAVQADAMMREMTIKGVIAPVANATTAASRALHPHHRGASSRIKSIVRKTANWMSDDKNSLASQVADEIEGADNAQENKNGQV